MLQITDFVLPSPDRWRIIIKGMRNAFKSWKNSDSLIIIEDGYVEYGEYQDMNLIEVRSRDYEDTIQDNCIVSSVDTYQQFLLGKKDKNLLLSLSKLGSSDRKALRQLPITLEIKAPLFWWKQMDTYKVGTTANSESSMHCITNKKFELKDFSYDNESVPSTVEQPLLHCETADVFMEETINHLNELRKTYLETKDKWYWQKIIELLPESYNQTRTVSLNYEVIINIIIQRYNHKLSEWQVLCKWFIDNIPLIKDILMEINPEIISYLEKDLY